MTAPKDTFHRHDFTRVGGSPWWFHVRQGIPNDRKVMQDVAHYAKVPVKGRNVLDIGGHIGCYAVLAAQLGARHVVSVEALPDNFRLLRKNAVMEEVSRHTHIWGAVVPNAIEDDTLLHVKACPSMCSVHVKGGDQMLVPSIGWRTLLHNHLPQVVKLDCEGAEYDILLKGGHLPASVQSVIVELHLGRKAWRNQQAPKVIDMFRDWYCLIEPRIGPTNWVTLGAWTR